MNYVALFSLRMSGTTFIFLLVWKTDVLVFHLMEVVTADDICVPL